jgi:hypothetical protein
MYPSFIKNWCGEKVVKDATKKTFFLTELKKNSGTLEPVR